MKKSLLALVFLVCTASAAAAQSAAIVIPAPVPALSNNCVFQYNATSEEVECNALGAASQPLTDSSPLIANAANATKLLAFDLAGISSATTRKWTIPDANLTIPTTIASLGANTFTALQTLNGGLAATTGSFSSTLDVTGAMTLSSTLGVTGLATFTGNLATDSIAERTAGAGVTIDGVLLKDGGATLTGALSGATTGAFSGNVTIGGTLGVTGASTLASLSATTGTFSSTLGVTGATTLSSTLGVTGLATFTGNLATNTIAERTAASGVTIDGVLLKDGAATLAGALAGATTGAFSSNVTVGGTLGVTGLGTFSANLAIGGTHSDPGGFVRNLTVYGSGSAAITLVRSTATAQTWQVGLSGVSLDFFDATGSVYRAKLGLGLIVGTPTGSFMGHGTVNAHAVYDDSVLLTDWVFDLHYDGQEQNIQQPQPPPQPRIPRGPKRLYSLTEVKATTETERRLPWMPTKESFTEQRATGWMITSLWQGQEQQQLYLFEHAAQIAALEARIAALEAK